MVHIQYYTLIIKMYNQKQMSSNWQNIKVIEIYVNKTENRITCKLKDL